MPELVVIAEQLLAPVPGGTGRYTAELLRALAREAPDGWTVSSVVARHTDVEAARVEGVGGPRVLPIPRPALAACWRLGIGYWPGGDAVHAPTPLAPSCVKRGRTLSVTVHDTVPWTHPDTLTPRGVSWHRKMITKAASSADALIVPTEAVATDLAERLPESTDIRVAGHGPTAALVPEKAAESTLELPERFVLAIGTLEPRKGIDILLAAVSKLDGVQLVLVGQPGWGGLDVRRMAAEHGLAEGRVRSLGRLSDADLSATLARASVLALPSRAEGFGLPVIEAMAAGVPVVHSDAPALVEVAGGAGITVARGDANALAMALSRVLTESRLATRMGVLGRQRAACFSWQDAAKAVWAIHQFSGC